MNVPYLYTYGMDRKLARIILALILTLAAGGTGYAIAEQPSTISIPAQTVTAPAPDTIRVLYSLDQKQNDREIIALIDGAKTHIYFAMYVFTHRDIAEALIAAKKRGVDVRGIVDSGESTNNYGMEITRLLTDASIPLVAEKHPGGTGIMHIKAIVTDSAYAIGSYNWTRSATTINDELLQVGTDETLRKAYENILKKLLTAYAGNSPSLAETATVSIGTIDYTEAPKHVGEYASVRGTLKKAYTSSKGIIFLDFCSNYKTCPFTAVIFADDAKKFGDLSRLTGKVVTVTGTIASYQGKAEIILEEPNQISE